MGLFTLAVFAWISRIQPALLEIYDHEKKVKNDAQTALLISSIIYGIIAIILTVFTFMKGSRTETKSPRSSTESRVSRKIKQMAREKTETMFEDKTATLGLTTKKNDTFGNGLNIDLDNPSENCDGIDDTKKEE